jgi:tungstate transport system ATP-binding protein
MNSIVYRLEDVAYAYPGAASSFALEPGPLSAGPGEVLALVGPNGAGKTTLLTLLAFLARPSRGRLEFRGSDPWASEDSVVAARREAVLVTHHPYLFKGTVADNISFGLKIRKIPEETRTARLRSALALVELEGFERKTISGMSAGQAQRVALARAMALRPKALLLDEPTAGIDAGLALRMEAILREVSRESGTTVVFSTHNFSQASRLADTILYLSEGRRVEFSHENCFSGTASTDGRRSWIEPRPGLRIVFPGETHGHVTCVIDPADICVFAGGDAEAPPPGPNVFAGRVTRMETTDAAMALVRVSGDLVLRVALPVADVEAKGISLSRSVLLKFEPEAVEIIGPRTAGNPHD